MRWTKAIPEPRDKLQSRLLGWTVGLLLAGPSAIIVVLAMHPHNSGLLCLKAVVISLTFGVLVWALRAATALGALCGSMVCLIITAGTGRAGSTPFFPGLAPLIALFMLTFAATRAGRARKANLGLAEGRRGRSAAQVVANLGLAALIVLGGVLGLFDFAGPGGGLFGASVIVTPCLLLAALCEATADTVSSEIGQAFGGRPLLLTTLRRVDPGADGAVTLLGTVAGVAAAAIVAATGA